MENNAILAYSTISFVYVLIQISSKGHNIFILNIRYVCTTIASLRTPISKVSQTITLPRPLEALEAEGGDGGG